MPKVILLEFNEMNIAVGTSLRRIIDAIGRGYRPYRVLPGGRVISLERTLCVQGNICLSESGICKRL